MIPEYKLFGMHENVGYMTCVLHTIFKIYTHQLTRRNMNTKLFYYYCLRCELMRTWQARNQSKTYNNKKNFFRLWKREREKKKVYISHITTTTEEQLNMDESIFAHGNTSRDTEWACWVNNLYCNIMSRQKEEKKNYDEILILSHTHMSII